VVNWGAVAVIAIVAIGALAAARRGFSSKNALNERFRDQRAQARAGLEANHIVPQLTALIMDVTLPLPSDTFSDRTEEEIRGLVSSQLRATGFRPQLSELQRLANDDSALNRHYKRAQGFALAKAWAGIACLPGLSLVGTDLSLDGFELNDDLILGGWIVLALAGVAAAVFWSLETREKNALVTVCERYE
jgi:hypothetical protein